MMVKLTEEQLNVVQESLTKALKNACGLGLDRAGMFGTSEGDDEIATYEQSPRISFVWQSDKTGDILVSIEGNTAASHEADETGNFPLLSIPAQLKKAGYDTQKVSMIYGGYIGDASAAGFQLVPMTWSFPLESFPKSMQDYLQPARYKSYFPTSLAIN